jgi:hypothetical protein
MQISTPSILVRVNFSPVKQTEKRKENSDEVVDMIVDDVTDVMLRDWL